MNETRIYSALPEFNDEEIDKILESGTTEELAILSLSVGEYDLNWKKAQDICVKLADFEVEIVRANAALGLAYIARTKGKLEKHIVKPVLLNLLKNCDKYKWRIVDSIEDINQYMEWNIGCKAVERLEKANPQN